MARVFNCGFARAFLYETRALALENIKKKEGESSCSYKNRVNEERFSLFTKQFEGNPLFAIQKGRFFIIRIVELCLA